MSYKITVDADECIGCGACTAVSENFEMNDENIAVPKQEIVEDLGDNQSAADSCPKECIKIEEQ
jgi:ferredoxin